LPGLTQAPPHVQCTANSVLHALRRGRVLLRLALGSCAHVACDISLYKKKKNRKKKGLGRHVRRLNSAATTVTTYSTNVGTQLLVRYYSYRCARVGFDMLPVSE